MTLSRALGVTAPIMISGTITDLSGRTLSGQTPTAFWHSLRHADPLTIGLNCALGAREMRAHLAEISRIAQTLVCAYPNAGLPNEFGLYDEGPEYMARSRWRIRRRGSRQCHRADVAARRRRIFTRSRKRVEGVAPRTIPEIEPLLRLSGLEPFVLTKDIPFVNIGERTNVTGSAKFRKLIKQGRLFRCARCSARSGRDGRAGHRHQYG